MVKHFSHQKTIGIVGATTDAQAFILKAKQLGFKIYLLSKSHKEVAFIYGADQVFTGQLEDEELRESFLMQCDLLVYYDETLNAAGVEELQKTVVVPQGDDLLSIAQDRVLQKAFFDSLSINIAPYATVVKEEDIEDELRSIGYPAVLRTNQVNPESQNQSYFIYEEEDIKEAASLLKFGTCVLESWIVSEHNLSLTAVKTANGTIRLFPIAKKEYRDERLFNIQAPAGIEQELAAEIERVGHVILENIDFRGVVTIDFLVTPADALYVSNIYPYPTILSRYTANQAALSATEAHVRAITFLPISEEIVWDKHKLYVPFYADQIEEINELITIQPDWEFTFYPIIENDTITTKEAIGHMIIETDDMKETLASLKESNL